MAIGFDTPLIGSMTVGMAIVVLGLMMLVGVILWASRVGKVREYGRILTVFALVSLVVMTIAMAVQPAQISVPPEQQPGQFQVLSVSSISGASYVSSTRTFTVVAHVYRTNHTISPATFSATFNVQRTDAGATTDIKTVTASVSQATLTDPVSGDSYKAILPTAYGEPNCDWSMTVGSETTTASDTLSAQLGLTPYQTGSFTVTITWNGQAFTTSNINENDVLYAASITIGGTVYTINVLIDTVS